MNEKIHALVFKAGAKLYSEPPMRKVTGVHMTFEEVDKFAELIVQKCIKVSKAHAKSLNKYPRDAGLENYVNGVVKGIHEAVAAIKEYFEVEE